MDIEKKNIVIATGGTGGHIFPSVSLSNFLNNEYEIDFITDKRGLKYLRTNKDLRINIINSGTIFSKNIFKIILGLIKIFFSIISSFKILIKLKPKLVVGMGGYSSFAVCLSAYLLKIPILIYENNLVIGRTNRFLLPLSKKILISTESIEGIKNKYSQKIFFSGYFLRKEIFETKRQDLKLEKELSILIIGGSQSAKIFGEYFPKVIKECCNNNIRFKIYQQCLDYQTEELNKIYKSLNLDFELFTFTEDLTKYYEKADLAITRSGASSLAELVNLNIPFITIPLPSSADNHQLKNAIYFKSKGYCFLLEQKYIFEKLFEMLKDLNKDRNQLVLMQQKMKEHSDRKSLSKTKELIKKVLNG
tara:strand:+ start:3071 stop:4156 length:1086 start_codon:yes stop_codon:yes gene_type:complete